MDTRSALARLLAAAEKTSIQTECFRLAEDLMGHYGGWEPLLKAPPEEWARFPAMTLGRRDLLGAVAELVRPCLSRPTAPAATVKASGDAFAWFRDLVGENQEVVRALGLSAAGEVLGTRDVFRGTLTDSPARPREILKAALDLNAASLIVGHNHPSGKTVPSDEDARFTARLVWAAELLGVKLLDHLIVGREGYFSFADRGLVSPSGPWTGRTSRAPGSRSPDGPDLN